MKNKIIELSTKEKKLYRDNSMDVIKKYKERTGLGLKEAVNAVFSYIKTINGL